MSASSSSSSSSAISPPPPSLHNRLKAIIDGARDAWTYAIFWRPYCSRRNSAAVLRWADGYVTEEQPKPASDPAAAEQELRRHAIRGLFSLVFGSGEDAAIVSEGVTDAEWFFFTSMTQSLVASEGLPGQAFLGGQTIWIAGADRLAAASCERARQGQSLGLQTMAWIPTDDGVVELGSTDVVVMLCPDLVNDVRVSINLTMPSL